MSYDISTGGLRLLADAKPHMTDEEYRRERAELQAKLTGVNRVLQANGLPAHDEPGPDGIRGYVWSIKSSYGALLGFATDVEARSERSFPHLLSNAGDEWVIVPVNFASPLQSGKDGMTVASSYGLYHEISYLAVLLGLRGGSGNGAGTVSDTADEQHESYDGQTRQLDQLTGFDAASVQPIEGLEVPARSAGSSALTDAEAGCEAFLAAARISLLQKTALTIS